MTSAKGDRPPFEIYRGADARDCIPSIEDPTPLIIEALTAFGNSGGADGQVVKMVYDRPGFSLSRVWFKSGYPLPLHAHTGDCLYYLLAGSIRLGTEELGPGDGFFVGGDVPYTYVPGPEGAEVLEFRAHDVMDIRFMAKTQGAWDKTLAKLADRKADWVDERPPTQRAHAG
jgi:hypothetical protein